MKWNAVIIQLNRQKGDTRVTPVELYDVQGALILRARGSELLILQQFIAELKKLDEPKAFAQYFLHTALVNRPARKLFEAWLRKDRTLWNRIFQKIHKEMEVSETNPPPAEIEKPAKQEEIITPVVEDTNEQDTGKKKLTKKKTTKKVSSKEETEVKKKKTKSTTSKKKVAEPKDVDTAVKKKKTTTKKRATTSKKKT